MKEMSTTEFVATALMSMIFVLKDDPTRVEKLYTEIKNKQNLTDEEVSIIKDFGEDILKMMTE